MPLPRYFAATPVDPTIVVNTPDRKLFDVGGPNDSFLGVALSPDEARVAVVGHLGRDTAGGGTDDGAVLWLRP